MSERRYHAEKLMPLLSDLESTEKALREALEGREDYVDLLHRTMELNASIRVRAETLARVVMQETALTTVTRCGDEFAGHVCGRILGHTEKHHDERTNLLWD